MTDEPPHRDRPASLPSSGDAPQHRERFARALSAAVAARGMSLEQLRVALAARGSQVSVATLSYWRSGRSRPDRGGSMVALAHLEEELELPAGFLVSKIAPRGPGSVVREGLPSHYVTGIQPTSEATRSLDRAGVVMATLGLSWDDGLARVSLHDRLMIRRDGTEGRHEVRTVFVAQRDGVDRYPVWYAHDDAGAFPFVSALTNVALGRVVEVPEQHGVLAEMLLDHPLRLGESLMVEHVMEAIGQTVASDSYGRRTSHTLRELAIEVSFAGDSPAAVTVISTQDGAPRRERVACTGRAARMLQIDAEPGVYGMNWGGDQE